MSVKVPPVETEEVRLPSLVSDAVAPESIYTSFLIISTDPEPISVINGGVVSITKDHPVGEFAG